MSCNAILFTWQGNALMGQVKFGKMTQNYFCFCRFFEAVHFVSPPTLINYWTFGGSVKLFCTLACSFWHWLACLCCWCPSISFERANAEKCPWHLQIQSHMAKIGAFAFRLPRRSFMLGGRGGASLFLEHFFNKFMSKHALFRKSFPEYRMIWVRQSFRDTQLIGENLNVNCGTT